MERRGSHGLSGRRWDAREPLPTPRCGRYLGSSAEYLGPRALQGVVLTPFGGVTERGWGRLVVLPPPSIGTTVKMP